MKMICDLDGVLIDSKKSVFRAYKKALGGNLSWTEFCENIWGKPWSGDPIVQSDKNMIYQDESPGQINFIGIEILKGYSHYSVYTGGSKIASDHKIKNMGLSCGVVCFCKKDAEFFNCQRQGTIIIDDDLDVLRRAHSTGLDVWHWEFTEGRFSSLGKWRAEDAMHPSPQRGYSRLERYRSKTH